MKVVDDVGMGVPAVAAGQMRMIGGEIGMCVADHIGIGRRPEPAGQDSAGQRHCGQHEHRGPAARLRSQPAGENRQHGHYSAAWSWTRAGGALLRAVGVRGTANRAYSAGSTTSVSSVAVRSPPITTVANGF